MGKHAAGLWARGQTDSLSTAVAETCKEASLTAEQVLRVIENTNSAAFRAEFSKEGAAHGVVDFGSSGPASASEVFGILGKPPPQQPQVKQASLDYGRPPVRTHVSVKTAAADDLLARLFPVKHEEPPPDTSMHEFNHMRYKLAGMRDQASGQISMLEGIYRQALYDLAGEIKKVASDGITMAQVVNAWSFLDRTGDHIKTACEQLEPLLVANHTFRSTEAMIDSLINKTASAPGPVNPNHPVMAVFSASMQALDKLAEMYALRDTYTGALDDLDTAWKNHVKTGGVNLKPLGNALSGGAKALEQVPEVFSKAPAGLRPSINAAAGHLAPHAGNIAREGVTSLVGKGHMANFAGEGASFVTKHALPLALAGAGYAAAQTPEGNRAYHWAQGHLNPLSQDWENRKQQEALQNMQSMGYY